MLQENWKTGTSNGGVCAQGSESNLHRNAMLTHKPLLFNREDENSKTLTFKSSF